jgi:hypothetical protein
MSSNTCLMCIKRLNRFHGQSHNWQAPSDVSGYWEYLFADKKEEGQRHTHTNRWALRWSGNASMNFKVSIMSETLLSVWFLRAYS